MKTRSPAARATLQKCVDLLRRKHYALTTEQVYCGHIGSYIDWLVLHGRDLLDSRARVEAFLTSMAHRGCSASTQNQAFNALLFFYEQVRGEKLPNIQALRAKQSRHKRTALPKEQTLKLLEAVEDVGGYPTRLVAWLLYGCALRVSEPLNVRIKDIDTSAWRVTLRGCKGGKDRTVIVPECLRAGVTKQLALAKAMWEKDREAGLPVEVPGLLARKYPKAPHAWQWFWLFPAHAPCRHPRTGNGAVAHARGERAARGGKGGGRTGAGRIGDTACFASLLCHAHSRCRGQCARCAGVAGACKPQYHDDLRAWRW